MNVVPNEGSPQIKKVKKSCLKNNGCYGYFMTPSQKCKKWKKICKNLYNFDELSLLNKKTFFKSVFIFW